MITERMLVLHRQGQSIPYSNNTNWKSMSTGVYTGFR